jgi:dephospho-CoA kinase
VTGMRIIGLTGSIGMGKTTTAAMFRDLGVPVHDADAAVHRLYAGPAVAAVEAAFPGVATSGSVDRTRLAERVLDDPDALARLEAIVHPLVAAEEARFLQTCRSRGERLVLLDIPLLFEAGGSERVDAIVLVRAAEAIQRQRVLARPGMTAERFAAIAARQMPDADKRKRAHFLVDTGRGMEPARRQVAAILRSLRFAP